MGIINLDHISSNPLLPEVKAAMIDAINADYHNPSSQHSAGERAAAPLDRARTAVAAPGAATASRATGGIVRAFPTWTRAR